MYSGKLGAARRRWRLKRKYVAWIQKFYYIRRLLELKVSVLALDSDVITMIDPYPFLHGVFGKYQFITAFDTKGGFANINVGIIYIRNASIGGPIHSLFTEFEERVTAGLQLPPPKNAARRNEQSVRFFWDQNLFNKVLLSAFAQRRVYLPDDSDSSWTRKHSEYLRVLGLDGWHLPKESIATPHNLTTQAPWYPATSEYKWRTLLPSFGSALEPERVLLAPPWLISADNVFGHRYKHWLYGARPPPCVFLHFVCVAAGEHSRILPMSLFGHWHEEAVSTELASLATSQDNGQASRSGQTTSYGISRKCGSHNLLASSAVGLSEDNPPSRRMLALADATLRRPLRPRPWPDLNALQALLGGLALLSGAWDEAACCSMH